MLIMVGCGLLLLAGIFPGFVWSGSGFVPPEPALDRSGREAARRFVWFATVAFTAGTVGGLAVIGGGGRLAMRLLAVTGGDNAQGRLTEADEVVGRITFDGTIAFIVFNGVLGGFAAGLLFVALRRALPEGRLGGVVFGLGLLIVLGATVDPIRRDNPDFDIVGPGWVALLVFTAMAVALGLTVQGLANRMSRTLPLPAANRRVMAWYALPAVLVAILGSVTVALALACAVVVAVSRWGPSMTSARSARWIIIQRIALIGLVAASLPNVVVSVFDIATR